MDVNERCWFTRGADLVAPQQLLTVAQVLPNIFLGRTDKISDAFATKTVAISSPDTNRYCTTLSWLSW